MPPGKASMDQPPPVIHSWSGCPRAQVAAAQLVPSEDRVGVRVDESGKEGATRQIYEIGAGSWARWPDRQNLPAPDSHMGALGEEFGAIEDGAVAINNLVCDRHSASPSSPRCRRLDHWPIMLSMPMTNAWYA